MRVLTQSQVTQLLPMSACIPLMASTLASLSRSEVDLPLRTVLRLPDTHDAFALMPALSATLPAFGAKVITIFPDNHGRGRDSHQGAVLMFDAADGRLLGVLDASSITAIRTAAISAVATDLLARPEAATLALLGSGVQARTHLEALALVRPFTRVHVWSRSTSHTAAFADWAREAHGLDVTACPSARDAVVGADVVCTVTASRDPVLEGAWLTPGTHVNAVGASQPDARELDSAAVAGARIVADRRESLFHESAEYRIPLQEGRLASDHAVVELGEIVNGEAQGRTSPQQITLFKSLGLAIEDVAAAWHVLQRAERDGVGTTIDLGGTRQDASAD